MPLRLAWRVHGPRRGGAQQPLRSFLGINLLFLQRQLAQAYLVIGQQRFIAGCDRLGDKLSHVRLAGYFDITEGLIQSRRFIQGSILKK